MAVVPQELIELAKAYRPKTPIQRTRIAPTPSGFLHEGNAINFLITWAIARAHGARVLLRIDDMDTERIRQDYLEDVFRSLEWLGIDWDEGPTGVEDVTRKWSQHHRLELYEDALTQLQEKGLLFACSCSRKDVLELSDDGLYPGTCRDKQLPFDTDELGWRLRMPEFCEIKWEEMNGSGIVLDVALAMGDMVVRKKDRRPAYQITSLIDDLHYEVDLIVRGRDLLPSTAYQLHLAELMGGNAFSEGSFLHHPLITDEAGGKLSKSDGSLSLNAMRSKDPSPDHVIAKAFTVMSDLIEGR